MAHILRFPGKQHWFTLIREQSPLSLTRGRKLIQADHIRTANILPLTRGEHYGQMQLESENIVVLSLAQWKWNLPRVRAKYILWFYQSDYTTLQQAFPHPEKWGLPEAVFFEQPHIVNLHYCIQAWFG